MPTRAQRIRAEARRYRYQLSTDAGASYDIRPARRGWVLTPIRDPNLTIGQQYRLGLGINSRAYAKDLANGVPFHDVLIHPDGHAEPFSTPPVKSLATWKL